MSAGEDALREALAESVRINRLEVQLASETVSLLRSEIELAVDGAVSRVLSPENAEKFWSVGFSMMHKEAKLSAGGFVLTSLRKGAVFLLLGSVIYSYGGWTALAGFVKAVKEL